MKKSLSSKGFGAIAALIVVLVLAAIGSGSYYVWHKNHVKKAPSTSATSKSSSQRAAQAGNSSSTTQQNAVTQGQYLEIKEWGVRIKPASSLPSVTYTIDDSNGHQWAVLKFKDLPDTCNGVYHFSRAMAGQDIDGYGNSPEKLLSLDSSSIKQVGDYYYYLGHGQAACAPDAAVTVENALIQQLTGRTTASNTDKYVVEVLAQ
jgi:hypothetical protein